MRSKEELDLVRIDQNLNGKYTLILTKTKTLADDEVQAIKNCHCFSFQGVQAYADALLVIIKTLAHNSGLDPQESIVKLQEEYTNPKQAVGLDIKTGQYMYNTCVQTCLNLLARKTRYFLSI